MAEKAWPARATQKWLLKSPENSALIGNTRFLPDVVLRRFGEPAAGEANQYESRPWVDGTEREHLTVYDAEAKQISQKHLSKCFGEANTYRRFFENFTEERFNRDGNEFRLFDRLKYVDEKIRKHSAQAILDVLRAEKGHDSIVMSREQHNNIRKALFMATYLQNKGDIQATLNGDPDMAYTKTKRKAFIAERKLSHERELWLSNAYEMLKTEHYDVRSHKPVHVLDRINYQVNARERFMVIWRAQGKDNEFILTNNSLGCYEGGPLAIDSQDIDMGAEEYGFHMYTKDYMWHQLYVISPTLVIALCHGSLLDPELARRHRRRFGLAPSLLGDLPHISPRDIYKDMTPEQCKFLDPDWQLPGNIINGFGSRQENSESARSSRLGDNQLGFAVRNLDRDQVARVNAVLLQNRSESSPINQICWRRSGRRSLLDALNAYENIDWEKCAIAKQRRAYSTLGRLLEPYFHGGDRIPVTSNASVTSQRSRGSSGAPSVPDDTSYDNPFDIRIPPGSRLRNSDKQPVPPESPRGNPPHSISAVLHDRRPSSPRERPEGYRGYTSPDGATVVLPSRQRSRRNSESRPSHRRQSSHGEVRPTIVNPPASGYRPTPRRREEFADVFVERPRSRRDSGHFPADFRDVPVDPFLYEVPSSPRPDNDPQVILMAPTGSGPTSPRLRDGFDPTATTGTTLAAVSRRSTSYRTESHRRTGSYNARVEVSSEGTHSHSGVDDDHWTPLTSTVPGSDATSRSSPGQTRAGVHFESPPSPGKLRKPQPRETSSERTKRKNDEKRARHAGK